MNHRKLHESEGIFELKKIPGEGMCLVHGCRNPRAPKKAGLCYKHFQHRWRMKSRKQSAYATLRDHAVQRGLEFTISYDYFLGMTDCAGFWDVRAESRGEWVTIDRVDASKGYVQGNIRVITHAQNSVKSHRERYLPTYVQSIIERKRIKAKENPHLEAELPEYDEDMCPF